MSKGHVGNVKNVFSPYEKRETRNNWGFPGSSAGEESACNAVDLIHSLGWEILWRRGRLPTPVFLGFPGGSDGKESTCNVGDLGPIPGLGRSPGGGHGNPQRTTVSCLESPHGQRSLVG